MTAAMSGEWGGFLFFFSVLFNGESTNTECRRWVQAPSVVEFIIVEKRKKTRPTFRFFVRSCDCDCVCVWICTFRLAAAASITLKPSATRLTPQHQTKRKKAKDRFAPRSLSKAREHYYVVQPSSALGVRCTL